MYLVKSFAGKIFFQPPEHKHYLKNSSLVLNKSPLSISQYSSILFSKFSIKSKSKIKALYDKTIIKIEHASYCNEIIRRNTPHFNEAIARNCKWFQELKLIQKLTNALVFFARIKKFELLNRKSKQ